MQPLPPDRRGSAALPPDHPQVVLRDALTLLSSVRATLADLLRDVAAGEAGAIRDLGLKNAELETALKRAFEAEARYNDWQAKQGGASPLGEIYFDAVREDIACRLGRLRACCQDD